MAGLSLPSGKMRNCSVGSVNISAVLSLTVPECPVHSLLIPWAPVQELLEATAGTQPQWAGHTIPEPLSQGKGLSLEQRRLRVDVNPSSESRVNGRD